MKVAFLDVCYSDQGAQSACVLADSWVSSAPSSAHVQTIDEVAPYEPGSFYKRELPCLLAVIHSLPEPPTYIVVDGYVWLPPAGLPGLGAHLYEALSGTIPVIGIAKRSFAGAQACRLVAPVLRGKSARPLFVTAVGINLPQAEIHVRELAGAHRIPLLAQAADHLARAPRSSHARAA
ncbi:endonuclease V [Piscinibacter defluvii]|uniref:endonuclease V n=1 Tax=Piscinibacter defluvii TaxID=1796922 RepID=UPI00197BBE5D